MSPKPLLIASRGISAEAFKRGLRKHQPDMDIRIWPETGNAPDVRYALVWKPPEGVLTELPNLEVIFSIGAGVDHVVGQDGLPDVPIVRFVDPNLTMRMTEYVYLNVLMHHRRTLEYLENQRNCEWKEWAKQPGADEIRVGVMGLGVLGLDAIEKLKLLGYQIAGWSRSKKQVKDVETFAGQDGMGPFLARTDILVCLLPHTPDTKGMLNHALFRQLAKDGKLPGPVVINAGRGKLQVEADILSALDAEDLWACSLDVFEEEPLPEKSPLWAHPRVVITPHNASISDYRAVCRYVLDQIAAYESGKPLENIVDRDRGY